jgi:hypothetical protein
VHAQAEVDVIRRRMVVWRYYLFAMATSALVLPLLAPKGLPLLRHVLGLSTWAICWYPTARYFARRSQNLPAFELICIAYAMQIALPAFQDIGELILPSGLVLLTQDAIAGALFLGLIGIASMQAGYYLLMRGRQQRLIPVIRLNLVPYRAVIYAVLMGIVGMVVTFGSLWSLFSWQELGGAQAIVGALRSQVNVAIVILVWLVYVKGYKVLVGLLFILVGSAVLAGLYEAGLEAVLIPIVVLVAARWRYLGKIPWALCVVGFAVFLFLQPAKGAFRDVVWVEGRSDVSGINDAALWVQLSASYWVNIFEGQTSAAEEGVTIALNRTSLLPQFALIYSKTPGTVPYQYGMTYSYLLVAIVPRALWPDKPIAQEANDTLALAYGTILPQQVGQTMTGISVLAESYANFGGPGVVVFMFLQGLILAALGKLLSVPEAGVGGQAIYLSIMVYFLNGIGSNTAGLYGGLIQIILFNCVLLWWARRSPKLPPPALRGHFVV